MNVDLDKPESNAAISTESDSSSVGDDESKDESIEDDKIHNQQTQDVSIASFPGPTKEGLGTRLDVSNTICMPLSNTIFCVVKKSSVQPTPVPTNEEANNFTEMLCFKLLASFTDHHCLP